MYTYIQGNIFPDSVHDMIGIYNNVLRCIYTRIRQVFADVCHFWPQATIFAQACREPQRCVHMVKCMAQWHDKS